MTFNTIDLESNGVIMIVTKTFATTTAKMMATSTTRIETRSIARCNKNSREAYTRT
jgi:hypothetical protein